jgi:chromosome segregation ATPase
MSSFYERTDELMGLLERLGDGAAPVRDMVTELLLLTHVQSVDLEEAHARLVDIDPNGHGERVEALAAELEKERSRSAAAVEKAAILQEQLNSIDTGASKTAVLNQRLIDLDAHATELAEHLRVERTQRDTLVKHFRNIERTVKQHQVALSERDQQFQNVLGLYQTEKSKRETIVKEAKQHDAAVAELRLALAAAEENIVKSTKELKDKTEMAQRLQDRQQTFEATLKQLTDKNRLVQKLSADLSEEKSRNQGLGQRAVELEHVEASLQKVVSELEQTRSELILRQSQQEQTERHLADASAAKQSIEDTLARREADLIEHGRLCEILREEKERSQQELKALQRAHAELAKEVSRLNGIIESTTRTDHMKASAPTAQDQIPSPDLNALDALESQLNDAKRANALLEENLARTNESQAKVASHMDALKTERDAMADQINSHKEQLAQITETHARKVAQFDERTKEHETTVRQYVDLSRRFENNQKYLKNLQDELRAAKECAAAVPTAPVPQALTDEVSSLMNDRARLESKLRSYESNGKVRELEMQIHKLTIKLQQKEKEAASVGNTAFIGHLEGSIRQLKQKLDQQAKDIQAKEMVILAMTSEAQSLLANKPRATGKA